MSSLSQCMEYTLTDGNNNGRFGMQAWKIGKDMFRQTHMSMAGGGLRSRER